MPLPVTPHDAARAAARHGARHAARAAAIGAVTARGARTGAALLLAAASVAPRTPLAAQSITVQVGDSARLTVAPGAKVGIPLRVDLANAGSTLNLASVQGTLTWATARLTFDSVRVNAASGFTQTDNLTGAAGGSVVLSYLSPTRLAASATLATAWFTAAATAGGTRVTYPLSAAGNEAATSILAQVVSQGLDLCVASSARWGDVNDDGAVSIIDAQQIARSSVGLSVLNAAAVAARGDVNGENGVNISDAQQIARFSVGLSAVARINALQAPIAPVASVALAPATVSVAVASTVALTATPRDSASADLTGCATVTYSSSAPAVATVSASGVVTGVSAGTATITATSGTRTATTAVTVTTAGLNYRIANAYIVQAVQATDRSTGLVAGREGLLRVFATASAANTATPAVRVTIYNGTTVLRTVTVTAPEASVRTAVAPELLTSTWNVTLSAAEVATGLRVLAELDPGSTLGEADRTDNSWPAGGTPQTFAVTTVPTFTVRYVPITIGSNTGNVTTANAAGYAVMAQRLFPMPAVSATVRAGFTSSVTALEGDNMEKWSTLLSEVNALRTADAAPSGTYYYGVLKAAYTSGIAGLAYMPGRAGVGWDDPGTSPGVVAHEWGHNFGRPHAPCDVEGEAAYPYAGGVIGQHGWNAATNAVVLPTATDIMGYCANQWVSDYTWNAVMQYRVSTSSLQARVVAARAPGVLVWGRLVEGRVVLEPAFPVEAPPSAGDAGGTLQVELRNAAGGVIAAVAVEPLALDHASDRHFAVVLPLGAVPASAVAAVRVQDLRLPTRAAERVVVRDAAGAPVVAGAAFDAGARVTVEGERVRVQWGAAGAPSVMAMVRDADSGEILGFARTSGHAVRTHGRRVEVVYSDGVQPRVKRAY